MQDSYNGKLIPSPRRNSRLQRMMHTKEEGSNTNTDAVSEMRLRRRDLLFDS